MGGRIRIRVAAWHGFASGLSMIGLLPAAIPLALVSFNVGVEIGQLLFVVAIMLAALAF